MYSSLARVVNDHIRRYHLLTAWTTNFSNSLNLLVPIATSLLNPISTISASLRPRLAGRSNFRHLKHSVIFVHKPTSAELQLVRWTSAHQKKPFILFCRIEFTVKFGNKCRAIAGLLDKRFQQKSRSHIFIHIVTYLFLILIVLSCKVCGTERPTRLPS